MINNANDNNTNDQNERAEPRDTVVDELMLGLRQRCTPDCPNENKLLQFLDQTLSAGEHARLLTHIRECPYCACLVADLRPVFAPIAQLHNAGLFHLYHSLKTALRVEPPALLEAWQSHSEGCARCRRRSLLLALVGIPLRKGKALPSVQKRMFSLPSFSAGLACMLLIALTLRQLPISEQTGESTIKTPASSSRSGTGEGSFPDLSAQGILTDLLAPPPNRLSSTLDVWNSLPAENNLPKQAALASIYLKQARLEHDPVRHRESVHKSREALLDVRVQAERIFQELKSEDTKNR